MIISVISEQPLFALGVQNLLQKILPAAKVQCSTHTDTSESESLFRPTVMVFCSQAANLDSLPERKNWLHKSKPQVILFIEQMTSIHHHLLDKELSLILPMAIELDHAVRYLYRALIDKEEGIGHKALHDEIITSGFVPDVKQLTKQEREVFKLTNKGFANREIAECLGMSINTVKVHLSKIYRKLGADNRTAAVSRFLFSSCPGQ